MKKGFRARQNAGQGERKGESLGGKPGRKLKGRSESGSSSVKGGFRKKRPHEIEFSAAFLFLWAE
jgi:hypothetical protein